jgi:Protein of unknown function (DUF1573)
MKNLKFILLVFVAVMLSNVMIAQQAATETKTEVIKKTKKKSAKKVAKETAAAVAQMDEQQQKMILNYTRNLSKADTKKEMMKAMKKMSAEDQQKVLDYMSKVTKTADVKAEMPAVANVKPEVPYVVKEKEKAQVPPPAKAKEEIAPVDPATLTKIEILEPTIDFGTIPQGESAKATYRVKNVGDKPLIITKAKGSCGCTVPEWPKEAIAPGDIAEIKVVFNSKGKKGKQNKRITITANTDPADSFMTITGTVEETAAPGQPPIGTDEQKSN